MPHFAGDVSFELVATATESSNLDSADTAVDITGRFVAVADEMVVSVAETTAAERMSPRM